MKTASRAHLVHQMPAARRVRGERGSATVELAITLPAVVLLLAALLLTGHMINTQLQSTEAARVAARVVALGESESTALTFVRNIAGSNAQLQIRQGADGALSVEVSRPLIAWSSMFEIRSELTVPWEVSP